MKKKFKNIFFILIVLLFFNSSTYSSDQLNKITKNLRCLICQGQSVYDSQSEFALSMKVLIQEKIQEGQSEKQIYNFLKDKYGDWIVYDPEINQKTILLWLFPLILFIFGGLLIARKLSIK